MSTKMMKWTEFHIKLDPSNILYSARQKRFKRDTRVPNKNGIIFKNIIITHSIDGKKKKIKINQ
jgi:hypothetical protein